MEKRLKRIEIGLIITIILVSVNLGYNVYQEKSVITINNTSELKKVPSLPNDLSLKSTERILVKIKQDYNNEDWLGIYDVLGNYSKSIIKKEEVEKEFSTLIKATRKIDSYAYSYYEYLGFEEGADWFSVYYTCEFENGSGVVKISFRTIKQESEVVGFNINLGELN